MMEDARPDPIRSPLLGFKGIQHGFFTRVGGVSQGIYAGLNIGTGSADEAQAVAENRRRIAESMGVPPDRLATVFQHHSAEVVTVAAPFDGERPKADAMVTDRPGIAIGVSTADCGPILLADPDAMVVGAAHAGWKGALTGVLENAILAMEALGADRDAIVAVLGPSISPANYEVGPEFVARFVAADPANEAWFVTSKRAGHSMFDLNGYTVERLRAAGVRSSMLARCTYTEEEFFFSYRRMTHRGEADYGRQLSAIVLEA